MTESRDANKNPSPPLHKVRRGNAIALGACFVIVALAFSEATTTLAIGLITFVFYQIVYRRNMKLLLLTVSLTVSLTLFEVIGEKILLRQVGKTNETDLDHRMKPDASRGINSDGIRCAVEASDFTDDTFTIIFLGDSFTYGHKIVNAAETWPDIVEARLRREAPERHVRTVNFGWTSSSPFLSLRLLRDIGAKYKPDLIVLALDMTDFHDDLSYSAGIGKMGTSPTMLVLHRVGLLDNYLQIRDRLRLMSLWYELQMKQPPIPDDRFFCVKQAVGESIRYMETTEAYVKEIAAYSRDTLGVPFMFVMLPRFFQYNADECPDNWEGYAYPRRGKYLMAPFSWLRVVESRVDFPCHSMLEDFKKCNVFPTCFQDDPHWNAAGHRVAAEAMLRILADEGYVPPIAQSAAQGPPP